MRSKESLDRTSRAEALGKLVAELAPKARPKAYDLTPGGTGTTELAGDTGMSTWAIRRMLRGETLPLAENVYSLGQALGVDPDLLLDTAGYRNRTVQANPGKAPVRSVPNPLTPEDAIDGLGITHPFVRKMLKSSIDEAIRLQREADEDEEDSSPGGATVAR